MGIGLPDERKEQSEFNYNLEDAPKQAILWIAETGISMIYPTNTLELLEDLWSGFNSMILKYRRISDWKSQEIFGLTNEEHYDLLKSKFLRYYEDGEQKNLVMEDTRDTKDIIPPPGKEYALKRLLDNMLESKEPAIDIVATAFSAKKNFNSLYENIVFSNIISDVCDKYDSECIGFSPEYICNDFPMLLPQDMEIAGVFNDDVSKNYYKTDGDNEVVDKTTRKKWFDEYKIQWESCLCAPVDSSRLNWIRLLNNDISILSLHEETNDEKIRAKKQALLELGWSPNVEFNSYNRNRVDSTVKRCIESSLLKLDFVDMRDIIATPHAFSESNIDSIYNLYIIYAYKDDKFDFVAYSFDESLKKIYIPKKYTFREEPIDNYKDHSIILTTVFVGKTSYDNLLERFNDVCDNYNKYNKKFEAINNRISKNNHISNSHYAIHIYTYSLLSIFGINIDDPKNIEFVYRFEGSKYNSKKVFILYFDKVRKYNSEYISNLIEKIKYRCRRSDIIISESQKEDKFFIETFLQEKDDRDLIKIADRLLGPCAKYLKVSC